MEEVKKVLFTDEATSTGGRAGKVTSKSGTIDLEVLMPIAEGFESGKQTNPEELFAAAYAACFDGAIRAVAEGEGIELTDTKTTVAVDFGKTSNGFGIGAKITATMDGVEQEKALEILEKAHQICPYSKATRGNINVEIGLA